MYSHFLTHIWRNHASGIHRKDGGRWLIVIGWELRNNLHRCHYRAPSFRRLLSLGFSQIRFMSRNECCQDLKPRIGIACIDLSYEGQVIEPRDNVANSCVTNEVSWDVYLSLKVSVLTNGNGL
jgi:hypothetical protein